MSPSAFFMLVAALGMGLVVQWLASVRTAGSASLTWMANPALALDARPWVSAVVVGILLRGPSLYLSLKAIHRVRTENYIAAMAALPFLSHVFQLAAETVELLELPAALTSTTLFGAMMVLGSLFVLRARSRSGAGRTDPRNVRG